MILTVLEFSLKGISIRVEVKVIESKSCCGIVCASILLITDSNATTRNNFLLRVILLVSLLSQR